MRLYRKQKYTTILLLLYIGFVVTFLLPEKAEAQTYNAIWITNLKASPNPMLYGAESTTITIDTLEYAQWFWLSSSTMVRPAVIVNIAGRPVVASMTSEWLGEIGFWGWWFYWWFNQTGIWTHQVVWDGKDLDGNLVPPGSYLAAVNVYAGGASTFGSIVINVEKQRRIILSLNPTGIQPEQETDVSVVVLDRNNNRVPNYPVTLQAFAPQYQGEPCYDCGGHSHDTNRPIGDFLSSTGNPIGSTIQGSTGLNGDFIVRYRVTKFGGIETIRAWGTQEPNVNDEERLTVFVPGFTFLPDDNNYIKIGGTNSHLGPPVSSTTDNNHYGTFGTIQAISTIASTYRQNDGERLLINDISLPNGGGFDIYGAWNRDIDSPGCLQRGHCTHRIGRNADISGTGQNGRVTNEREFAWTVNTVARNSAIIINYRYHRNHYHFSFGE